MLFSSSIVFQCGKAWQTKTAAVSGSAGGQAARLTWTVSSDDMSCGPATAVEGRTDATGSLHSRCARTSQKNCTSVPSGHQ